MKEQMKFILASNNPKKLKEMGEILAGLGIQVISMAEAGIQTQPEETGRTFEENALIKAQAACQAGGLPALADDSGLAVEALDGAPGIHSARYCPGTDWDRLQFLLKNMENIPEEERGPSSSRRWPAPGRTAGRLSGGESAPAGCCASPRARAASGTTRFFICRNTAKPLRRWTDS